MSIYENTDNTDDESTGFMKEHPLKNQYYERNRYYEKTSNNQLL